MASEKHINKSPSMFYGKVPFVFAFYFFCAHIGCASESDAHAERI